MNYLPVRGYFLGQTEDMAMIHTSRTQLNIGTFAKDSENMNLLMRRDYEESTMSDNRCSISHVNAYQASLCPGFAFSFLHAHSDSFTLTQNTLTNQNTVCKATSLILIGLRHIESILSRCKNVFSH